MQIMTKLFFHLAVLNIFDISAKLCVCTISGFEFDASIPLIFELSWFQSKTENFLDLV